MYPGAKERQKCHVFDIKVAHQYKAQIRNDRSDRLYLKSYHKDQHGWYEYRGPTLVRYIMNRYVIPGNIFFTPMMAYLCKNFVLLVLSACVTMAQKTIQIPEIQGETTFQAVVWVQSVPVN